jgi:transcription initiation factor TFIIIB Brf1 subunit/transcription initiation factor TFIIB
MNDESIENYTSLWEIADLAFEELKIEEMEEKTKEKTVKTHNPVITCEHKNVCENICTECGLCLYASNILHDSEWNNYKDDSGNYAKNTQRCDVYTDPNPYSKGGTLLNNNKNSFIAKLQIQQTFSHKQKTYWLVGEEFERACTYLKINNRATSDSAKNYWHKCMESGKLTRASVRKGLIASCLFYSCVINNTPIERQEIIKAFNCDTKTLSKGEKVLFEILNIDNLTYVNIQTDDSNSFVRYCSVLKLNFNVSHTCNLLHNKYKIQLQAVTPKSAVGGIIAYIVKYKLLLKTPTKTVISATVDVCTPTLNKVIQMIYDFENK